MNDWRLKPHRRYNPLTGQWVLVSPHRADRPWQGETPAPAPQRRPQYDPNCYLCPGNARAGGTRNPDYDSVFVFDNDFAALLEDTPEEVFDDGTLFRAHGERGLCRVICFSPRHDLDLGQMSLDQIRRVVDAWAQQYREIGSLAYIKAVTIFENRGPMMGESSPHPHGQIWANASIPNELVLESTSLASYRKVRRTCLLCDYAERERKDGERSVYSDDQLAVVVPFWATWPFEVLILPRRHAGSLDALDSAERQALATAIKDLVARYDRLFATPFPYSMGFHQRPTDGDAHQEWHLHAHYLPPLLRSANIRKYMVGYEMLAQPQRDLTPEDAAERLRRA